jgi:hypothetical protein
MCLPLILHARKQAPEWPVSLLQGQVAASYRSTEITVKDKQRVSALIQTHKIAISHALVPESIPYRQ